MFIFLSLFQLSRSGSSITDNPMEVGQVNVSEKQPETQTFTNVDDFGNYLRKNGVSKSDASKLSKRMAYSYKIGTIVHTFGMTRLELLKMRIPKWGKVYLDGVPDSVIKKINTPIAPARRISYRKSVIVKAHKEGSNIVATVSNVVGETEIKATKTKKTWDDFLWVKYNHNSYTENRPLTAQEIEKINQLIDDKTRPLIKKYSQ